MKVREAIDRHIGCGAKTLGILLDIKKELRIE